MAATAIILDIGTEWFKSEFPSFPDASHLKLLFGQRHCLKNFKKAAILEVRMIFFIIIIAQIIKLFYRQKYLSKCIKLFFPQTIWKNPSFEAFHLFCLKVKSGKS